MRLLWVSFCLLALLTAAVASAAPAQRVRTGEARADLDRDPRLARPLSVSRYRMYLGELLERITRETGVSLETDERNQPLSGYELALVVHERPAWEVLDAIARMYAYPPERWYWSKTTRNGAAVYTLHNTIKAADLLRLREQQGVAFVLDDFRRKKNFYSLAAPQRASAVLVEPLLKPLDTPQAESAFSFLSTLPEARVRSIIQGNPLTVPADRFTPQQRRYLVDTYEQHNSRERSNPEVLEGKRPPFELRADEVTEATVVRDDSMGGLFAVALKLGNSKALLLGGFSLLKALREQPSAAWRITDELAPAPPQAVPVPGLKVRPDMQGVQNDSPDRVLERLGQAGKLNLVYDRPVMRTFLFYRVFGVKLEGELPDVLKRLEGQNLIWKRKDLFFAFRLADLLGNRRDVLVPWPQLRRLRQTMRASKGYLNVEALLQLSALRPEQQEYLRLDYVDLSRYLLEADLISLLQFAAGMDAATRAGLSAPTGSGWDEWPAPVRKQAEALFGVEKARTVRVVLRDEPEALPRPRLRYGLLVDGMPARLQEKQLLRCREDLGTLFPELDPELRQAAP
jgi:hypothetical protein